MLLDRLARLERQMDSFLSLLVEMQGVLSVLDRNDARIGDRLSALRDQLARLDGTLETIARTEVPLEARLTAIADWVERSDEQLRAIDEQLKKLNRSQFKANTLAESQAGRMDSALQALRDSLELHREELAQLQQTANARAAEARLQVVEAMLPVLDGIEQALDSGRSYLERQTAAAGRKPGLRERLAQALGRRSSPDEAAPIEAWLSGLELVRERMLAVLANEGVHPILAVGQSFDPYRHVAVALADPTQYPDAAPGRVVEEQRRGYLAGQRVLRFAEVVVLPAAPAASALSSPVAEEPASVLAAGEADGPAGDQAGPVMASAGAQGGLDSVSGAKPKTLDPSLQEILQRFEERQRQRQQQISSERKQEKGTV